MNLYEKIKQEAKELAGEIKEDRRDLHRYPERGWMEFRTSAKIADRLKKLGYERIYIGRKVCAEDGRLGMPSEEELGAAYERAVLECRKAGIDENILEEMRGGFTGVIAELPCAETVHPVVALRFDIDALGVNECEEESHRPVREGFSSRHKGEMHACGHDGHTAVGLAAAKILMRHRNEFSGTIRLIFQPAEEGCRGAAAIAKNGWLSDVDFVYGNHVTQNDRQHPECAIDPGTPDLYGSATAKYDVSFLGRAAHAGGFPQDGRNALLAAAVAVQNLYAISRDSEGYTRVNVGKICGGTGRNVIPDRTDLMIEVRGETDRVNEFMKERAFTVLKSAAAMQDCEVEIQKVGEGHPIVNDDVLRKKIAEVCDEMNLSYLGLLEPRFMSGTAEDFGDLSRTVQKNGGKAVFFRTYEDLAAPLHDSCMDFDEETLVNTVCVFCGLTAKLLCDAEVRS